MWTLTQQFLLLWLQWLSELGTVSPSKGPLDTLWIGLYQTGTTGLSWTSPLSALTECNYDGYARQECVFYPAYVSTLGPVTLEAASQMFAPTDSASTNTVLGIFAASASTGGYLAGFQGLPAPGVVLATPLSVLKIVADFQLPNSSIYGGCTVFS